MGDLKGQQPSKRRRIARAILIAVIVGALGGVGLAAYLVATTDGTLRFVP